MIQADARADAAAGWWRIPEGRFGAQPYLPVSVLLGSRRASVDSLSCGFVAGRSGDGAMRGAVRCPINAQIGCEIKISVGISRKYGLANAGSGIRLSPSVAHRRALVPFRAQPDRLSEDYPQIAHGFPLKPHYTFRPQKRDSLSVRASKLRIFIRSGGYTHKGVEHAH